MKTINEYNYAIPYLYDVCLYINKIKVRAVFGILHASILHTFGEFMTSDCNNVSNIGYDL